MLSAHRCTNALTIPGRSAAWPAEVLAAKMEKMRESFMFFNVCEMKVLADETKIVLRKVPNERW